MADSLIRLSVVIPTLNASLRLDAALDSVAWADDVIVVDGGSTDGTIAVARSRGARIMEVGGETIGAQRNAGIAAARHPWVLALDSDEVVSPALRASLTDLCSDSRPASSAYRVRSRNWYLGKELHNGPWGRDWKVRVFSRDRRFSNARVHERLESNDIGILGGDLIHYPYEDLPHHVAKIAKYSAWAAEDMRDRGRRVSTVDLVTRPAYRFLRDYVLLSGWRDGRNGFIAATASAFSVFCKYATAATRYDECTESVHGPARHPASPAATAV